MANGGSWVKFNQVDTAKDKQKDLKKEGKY
jgi:hypothetical protein